MTTQGDLTLVLDGLLDQAVQLSGADVAALVRIDSGLGTYIAVSHELGKPFIGATWPLSESIGVGEAGGRNEVVRMPDARHIELPAALHGMPVVGSSCRFHSSSRSTTSVS